LDAWLRLDGRQTSQQYRAIHTLQGGGDWIRCRIDVCLETLDIAQLRDIDGIHSLSLVGSLGEANALAVPVGESRADVVLPTTEPSRESSTSALNVSRMKHLVQGCMKSHVLQELEIIGLPVDQSVCSSLEATSVVALNLIGTGVGDGVTPILGRLPRLVRLRLCEEKITDQGVRSLVGSKTIQRLDLSWSKISDACVHDLCEMPALREVHLNETAVSEAAAGMLKSHGRLVSLSARGEMPFVANCVLKRGWEFRALHPGID
jgi:hypothetical protein